MKFEIERGGIVIFAETEQDKAYIEDTLGLKCDGDTIPLRRRNLSSDDTRLAWLETHVEPIAAGGNTP